MASTATEPLDGASSRVTRARLTTPDHAGSRAGDRLRCAATTASATRWQALRLTTPLAAASGGPRTESSGPRTGMTTALATTRQRSVPGKNKNPMLGWHPPAELSAWVRAEAERRGVTVSVILNEALEAYRRSVEQLISSPLSAGEVRTN